MMSLRSEILKGAGSPHPREPWEWLAIEFSEHTLKWIRVLVESETIEDRKIAMLLLRALADVQTAGAYDLLVRLSDDRDLDVACGAMAGLVPYGRDNGVLLPVLQLRTEGKLSVALRAAGDMGLSSYRVEILNIFQADKMAAYRGDARIALKQIDILNSSTWREDVVKCVGGEVRFEREVMYGPMMEWSIKVCVDRGLTEALPALRSLLDKELERNRWTSEMLVEIARVNRSGEERFAYCHAEFLLFAMHQLNGDLREEEEDLLRAIGVIGDRKRILRAQGLLADMPTSTGGKR